MAIPADVKALFDEAFTAAAALPEKFSAAEWGAFANAVDRAMAAGGFPKHELIKQPNGSVVGFVNRSIFYRARELDATQRSVAELLALHPEIPTGSHPLPSAHWALRQWIGVDPPGVLFRERDGATTLFETVRTLMLEDDAAAKAYLSALPLIERIDALSELLLVKGDYWSSHVDALLWALIPEIDGSLGGWAKPFAARLVAYRASPPKYGACHTATLLLPTFLALVRAGVAIEPAFDSLLPISPSIDEATRLVCINAIPKERREAAIVGAVHNVLFPNDRVRALQRLLARYPYPALAAYILAHVDEAWNPKEALRDVKFVAKTSAAIKAVLVAHTKAQAPIPTLRAVSRQVDLKAEALSGVQKAQLSAAAKLYSGKTLTAEQVLANVDEDNEMIMADSIELLSIERDSKPAYDAWLYMSDSGSIFEAGTTTLVAEIIQAGVECGDKALCAALIDALSTKNMKALRTSAKRPAAAKKAVKKPAKKK